MRDMMEDGVPVVDLNSGDGSDVSGDNNNCNCGCEDDVVEFGDVVMPDKQDDNNVVEF